MKTLPLLFTLVLFTGCEHTPPRTAPSASTAALSERLAMAHSSVTTAQENANKAGANVERARGNSDRIGIHLDTIDYKGMRLKKLLEE